MSRTQDRSEAFDAASDGARRQKHQARTLIDKKSSPRFKWAGAMAQTAKPVELKREAVEAFEAYIRDAEAEMERTLDGSTPFLWSDRNPERTKQVESGKVAAQFWAGRGPAKVPHGLIHDWIGAAFIA